MRAWLLSFCLLPSSHTASAQAGGQSVLLPQAGELKVGDSALTGKVQRVFYTEHRDLANDSVGRHGIMRWPTN